MSDAYAPRVFDQLPKGVKYLVLVNAVFFLFQYIVPQMVPYLALTPMVAIKKYFIWQFVTYAFLHGSFWHIFINMFALWMFGTPVERQWGTLKFLRFYFVCVVGAGLLQTIVAPQSTVLGASGGIYGLLLAFGLLFPDSVIYLFFVFPLRAIQAVFVIAFMTLLFSLQSGGSTIAHLAHLGGMLTGFIYMKVSERHLSWPSFPKFGRSKMKVVFPDQAPADQLAMEVDRILEKISKFGVNSLTEEEHLVMRRYSAAKR